MIKNLGVNVPHKTHFYRRQVKINFGSFAVYPLSCFCGLDEID